MADMPVLPMSLNLVPRTNGESEMKNLSLKLSVKLYLTLQALRGEAGQDLIEYVLIGGVVALGAVAGMQSFADKVNTAFGNLGTKLTTYAS